MSTFHMSIKLRFLLNRLLFLPPILAFVVACSPPTTPTPFRPPTQLPPTQLLPTTTPLPTITIPLIESTATSPPTEGPCSNELTFLDDLTVEDGTTFSPGAAIDKKWLVQNDGSCDWDESYKLKWVGGYTLGVSEEQTLFPARAGIQATLEIVFTAPTEPGTYQSTWQAMDPEGNLFGDTVFMEIVVTP